MVDSVGNMVVADNRNPRLYPFTQEGKFGRFFLLDVAGYREQGYVCAQPAGEGGHDQVKCVLGTDIFYLTMIQIPRCTVGRSAVQ